VGHYERTTRNRRDTVKLTHNGKTKCMAEWAEDLGVTPQAIRYRLNAGYSIEDIFTKPFRE